jgi:hypothetical protein
MILARHLKQRMKYFSVKLLLRTLCNYEIKKMFFFSVQTTKRDTELDNNIDGVKVKYQTPEVHNSDTLVVKNRGMSRVQVHI